MDSILLHVLLAALYLAGGIYFWQTRWKAQHAVDSMPATHSVKGWEHVAILIPLILHTALLYKALFSGGHMHFGFGYALSIMVWLAAWFYWVESFFVPLESIQALLLPIAAACAPLPVLFPGITSSATMEMPAFQAHLLIAMMAYSLFAIATAQALLMALMEKHLHGGAVASIKFDAAANLPPLLTLEKFLFQLVWIGFILLSATLVSGMLFSEEMFGKPLRFDHKTLFGILSWCIFAVLLFGRHLWGWRGRVALSGIFFGFVMLVLAYIGSRFVLEVVLHRV